MLIKEEGDPNMKRMIKLLTLGVGAIVVLSTATNVYAICPNFAPVQNFNANIISCPDAFPVAGFVGALGSFGTINSAGLDVVCEDANGTNGQFVPCTADVGSAGDGIVRVTFDWGNSPPANGCPVPAPPAVPTRNVIGLVCNNGAGVLMSVAFDVINGEYIVDYAQPLDLAAGTADLTASTLENGLKLAAPVARAGGNDTVCIDQTSAPVKLYTDCDPTSLAIQAGIPCPDTPPTAGPGANLYLVSGPRLQKPQDLRVSGGTTPWAQQATTAGPAGSKCVTFPTPTTGLCAWVGSTALVGGTDTGAITGWVEDCDPTAATDKLKINSAAFDQGKLAVSFSTENEALTVGFNVYAGSTKLNTGLIAAKGTGSNTYSFEVGRGAVKSNKTVTVEAVKSDGTVVKTAPANVK
jgi:hypothetical protein